MSNGVWHTFAIQGARGAPFLCGLRFVECEGRYVPVDVLLHGGEGGVAPADLRAVPLSRWEAMVNVGGGVLERELERGRQRGIPDDPRLSELEALLETLLAYTKADEDEAKPTRAKLTRPDGSDPETFYAAVAEAYREYARDTRAVATRIAEEAGVPVTTAHRWIREARNRGFLPPGQKGRAG